MLGIIVNADDFGLNERCTLAIAEAFKKGLITDTTMVANGTYFEGATELSRKENFSDKIGIHFNITEGIPLTENIKKLSAFTENGEFHGKINRLRMLSRAEKNAVYEEFSAQIKKIEAAGININHADSHHHIHTAIFIAPSILKVCREHGIKKIRLHRNIGSISLLKKIVKRVYNDTLHRSGFITTRFFGSLEDLTVRKISDDLEIMVHPDFDKNGSLIDRVDEVDGVPIGQALPDLSKMSNIKLTGYGEL